MMNATICQADSKRALMAAHREACREITPDPLAKLDRAGLATMYLEEVGYDPFLDSPDISEELVRQTLREFLAEANS